jgi:hypothetical protein
MSIVLNCPLGNVPLSWGDKKAMESITGGGSKAGPVRHILNNYEGENLREYLPANSDYLEPGGDINSFLQKIDFSKPKIVRACHPFDFNGMVDVIETHKNINGREIVRQSIEQILKQADSDSVKSWMKYESEIDFDGKVGILVQDYIGPVTGSIIEYPHEKGTYRIFTEDTTTPPNESIAADLVFDGTSFIDEFNTKDQKTFKGNNTICSNNSYHDSTPQIVELYKKVKDSGLIPDSHSFQMEFGIDTKTNRVKFYQARIFRPFVTKEPGNTLFCPYRSFGTTNGSELILPLRYLSTYAIGSQEPSAYVFHNSNPGSDDHRKPSGLDVMPNNLCAYLIPADTSHKLLNHGHFRWIQRAPVVAINPFLTKRSQVLRALKDNSKAYEATIEAGHGLGAMTDIKEKK